MTDPYENIRKALISFGACGSHYWRDELARECDPDTIRALLAERDALLEALTSARDFLAVAIEFSWEGGDADVSEHVIIKKIDAAIAAANGGTDG